MAKHVKLPESWLNKCYTFELFECINGVVLQNVTNELLNPLFNAFIAGERTGTSVIEMLDKFRS
jgi:hypothetical protein